jgi:NAD(P)H-hydrate epimerase
MVIAGSLGTSGAAALAATGALRAGAGLVTAAVPDPVRADVVGGTDPGVMVRGLPAGDQGAVAAAAVHALPNLDAVDVVVAGPGLGYGPGAAEIAAALRRDARRLVLDADALNVQRDAPDQLAEHRGELVLTPHERELSRIGGGADGHDAWEHRVERVPDLARDLDATVVVKGPGTMVVAPDGRVWVCPMGGPALGSGGTGDALAGIIGAAAGALLQHGSLLAATFPGGVPTLGPFLGALSASVLVVAIGAIFGGAGGDPAAAGSRVAPLEAG